MTDAKEHPIKDIKLRRKIFGLIHQIEREIAAAEERLESLSRHAGTTTDVRQWDKLNIDFDTIDVDGRMRTVTEILPNESDLDVWKKHFEAKGYTCYVKEKRTNDAKGYILRVKWEQDDYCHAERRVIPSPAEYDPKVKYKLTIDRIVEMVANDSERAHDEFMKLVRLLGDRGVKDPRQEAAEEWEGKGWNPPGEREK